MHIEIQKTTDQNIIAMIADNNMDAWGLLYDKYAPYMYGIICNLTDDRAIAEDILKKAFVLLKEKEFFSKVKYTLCPSLLRHTHTVARQQLEQRGINYSYKIETNSIIDIVCSQNISLKEVASQFNISEEEAKKKLRTEFLELQNQKKQNFFGGNVSFGCN